VSRRPYLLLHLQPTSTRRCVELPPGLRRTEGKAQVMVTAIMVLLPQVRNQHL